MKRVVLLLLAGWSMAGAPGAHAAERCSLPGATFIAKSARAQLFSVKANGKKGVQRRYFGCRLGQRPLLLAADIAPKSPQATGYRNDTFRIGGTWAAWVERTASHFGAGESSTAIHVRSLAGARRAVDVFTQAGGESHGSVAALSVGSDGAVAFLLVARGGYVEIDGVPAGATKPVAVAYARGIRKASLRLGAGKVTWVQDGVRRSAALSAPPAQPSGSATGPQGLDGRFGDCGTLVPAAVTPAGARAVRLADGPGGSFVAAGTTTSRTGSVVYADTAVITRFSAAGRFDQGFGGHGAVQTALPRPPGAEDALLTGLVVLPGGGVEVALNTQKHDGTTEPMLVRYDASGRLDPTFGSGGIVRPALPYGASAAIAQLALAPDGGVIAAGVRDGRWMVVRYRADGTPDPAFGSGGIVFDSGGVQSDARALLVAPDGTVVIGGAIGPEALLARLDTAGRILSVSTASPPGAAGIDALTFLAGGAIAAGGGVSNITGANQLFLGRYTATGGLDRTFARAGFAVDPRASAPRALAAAADGRLLATGSFAFGSASGPEVDGVVRYTAAGTRDPSFGFHGVLGGTTSYGLVDSDVLLRTDGTALVAQKNGLAFAISRFAVDAPATDATKAEPSVCAMLVSAKLGALAGSRKLAVGLRLRRPGRLHLRAAVTVAGHTVGLGEVTLSARRTIEAAVATIPISKAARGLLRGAKRARIAIAGGLPGAPARRYAVTLKR